MLHSFWFRYSLVVLLCCTSLVLSAQTIKEPSSENQPEWSAPYQPFRIAGNLYYVGTYDLACYLVTSADGHILINTGLAASASQIKANIEQLGFRFSDLKLLLTTQAHHDHLGAMAAIQKQTGAKVWVNAPDAAEMAEGGANDYALGTGVPSFAPIKADSLLKHGDTIRIGKTNLVMLSHPGHTKGSCSYLLKTSDETKAYTILIANLPSIVTEKKFNAIPEYPIIASDYAKTFASLKSLGFDLWVASHASQFQLHKKRKPGDGYKPEAFRDKKGFDKAVSGLKKTFKAHLAK